MFSSKKVKMKYDIYKTDIWKGIQKEIDAETLVLQMPLRNPAGDNK